MHSHSHEGSHDHRHHARTANARRLGMVLGLSAFYMFAEVAGGLITGSLALLADAGHMLSDVASLCLALFAIWIARRPASSQRTYGHTRAEILAAMAQGLALVAVAVLVAVEALERLRAPVEIQGIGMLVVASGGLLINLLGLWILGAGSQESLNMRGAYLHVLSDTLGSLGVIVAAFCVWQLGWLWADAAVSIAISGLVLVSAWFLTREATDVLMETAPRHLDVEGIRRALLELPAVEQVHDLHVWTIGSGEVSLSSHVVAHSSAAYAELLAGIHSELNRRFGIEHATIQIEAQRAGDDSEDGCASGCDEPSVLAVVRDG